jgi:hypothetical protein
MADVRGGFGPFLGVLLQGNTKHAEIGEFICLQVKWSLFLRKKLIGMSMRPPCGEPKANSTIKTPR